MAWMVAALVALSAVEHGYFFVLEAFLWTKPLGLKTFRMSPERARDSAALAANQGLYNAFLAAGLAWSLLADPPGLALQLKVFFLACVALAGIVGGLTVSRSILLIQGGPALVALLLLWTRR